MSNSFKSFQSVLRDLRLESGLSQKDLAKAIGITPANISYYESGKAQPRAETIDKLAKFFNVENSIFFDSIDTTPNTDFSNLISVPILNWVEASLVHENFNFQSNKQLILDTNLFDLDKFNTPKLFALEINNYTMYPKFIPSDIVIVDCSDIYLQSGSIHILSGEIQEVIMRQCSLKLDGSVELISLSPEFPNYTYNVEDFKVIGKVVLKISKV